MTQAARFRPGDPAAGALRLAVTGKMTHYHKLPDVAWRGSRRDNRGSSIPRGTT